ncbi:hypothetical protein RB839 [Rhodopirellula baltica SH 1]|uniref:Uncharacterized protein n=1 Tax=Rhodopirellula baltica (strain DSM 10527 / NCIMB 13988 / SH1) TaxID=243090 RepID=Q7UY69_RHOBA|nr:hypothetical protein RB839 [Rhodopirellula baltica SH 1]
MMSETLCEETSAISSLFAYRIESRHDAATEHAFRACRLPQEAPSGQSSRFGSAANWSNCR